MSTTVDNRIVEMKFNNSNFEKNIKQSKDSLEKFKSALNLTPSAEKMNKEINSAVRNINFDAMSSALLSLEQRFSTLGIMGMTVITNITNSAISLVKNSVGTISKIINEGGKKRAQNIENAKFQLNGLDIAWNEISKDISYGVDQTAYGLDSAAMAAAQLSASGVEFGEKFGETGNSPMAKALRGISGLAAMTNSSYEDMSRIFTTVAGNGRLMGDQLLQISSRGINAAQKLAEVFNGVNKGEAQYAKISDETKAKIKELTGGLEITETQLRDFVSKGKIDFAMFSESMDAAFGTHAKKANDTLNGVLSNIRSALSKIGADFWTPVIENEGKLVEMLNSVRELINDVKSAIRDTLGWAADDNGIEYLMKWKKLADGVFSSIKEKIDGIDRTVLKRDVLNILTAIQSVGKGIINLFREGAKIFRAVTQAFRDIFSFAQTSNTFTGTIRDLANKFRDFTKTIKINSDTFHKLKDTFRGFFAVLDIGWQILKGVFGVIKSIFKEVLPLGDGVLSITGTIGNLLVKLDEFLKKNEIIKNVFEIISNVTSSVIQAIKNFVSSIVEGFSSVAFGSHNAEEGFKRFGDKIKEVSEKIKEFIQKHMPKLSESGFKIGTIFGKIGNFMGTVFGKLSSFFSKIAPFLKTITGQATELLDKLVDAFLKIFNNLDVDKVFKVANGGIFTTILLGISRFIKNLGSSAGHIKKIFDNLRKGITGVIGENGTRASLIRSFAISIGILAASLFVLSSVEPEKLIAPLGALSAVMLEFKMMVSSLMPTFGNSKSIFGAIRDAIKDLSFGYKLGTIGSAMIKFAGAIFILAAALRMLADLDIEHLIAATAAISILMYALTLFMDKMAGLAKSMKMMQAKRLDTISSALIKLSIAVYILSKAVKSLAELSWDELARGLTGFGAILIGIVYAAESFGKIEKDISKFGTALIPFAIAIGILTMSVKSLAKLDWNQLAVGLTGFAAILGGIVGMAVTFKYTGASLEQFATSLIPFAIGIGILTLSLKSLAKLNWNELAVGLTGFAAILGGITAMSLIFRYTGAELKQLGLSMIPFAAGVLLLAAGVKALSGLNWNQLAVGLAGFAGALGGMVAVMLVLHYTKVNPKSMLLFSAAIAAMAAAFNLLIPPLLVFGHMGWGNIAKGMAVLAGVLVIFAVAANLLAPVGTTMLITAAGIAALGIACMAAGIGIAALAVGLAALGGSAAAVGAGLKVFVKAIISLIPTIVDGLGELIKSFAVMLENAIPSLVKSAVQMVKGICEAIIQAAPMVFDTIIKMLDMLIEYIPQIVDRVITIIIKVIEGVANRMPELVNAIAKLVKSFIGAVLDLFKDVTLGEFLAAIKDLSTAAVLLALAGQFGIAALKGIAILALMIVGIGAIVTALGWLITKVPELEGFLEKGIPVLEKIGYGIGSFIGNLVGGLLAGISSGLPTIADNLSEFMTRLQPFIDGAKNIDQSVARGALALAETILVLTGASLLDGIAKFFGADTSFAELGDQLVPFGESMIKFSNAVKDLDSDVVDNAATAGLAIAKMAAALPNSGGVAGFFAGENDMGAIAPQLVLFGVAMRMFSLAVTGMDTDVVENAANAGKAIAEMASALPNSGGVAGFFAGENDMGTIAPQLVLFGWAMKYFSIAVEGINADAIQGAAIAGTAIANMASTLPNSGGVVSWFVGNNDMDAFGVQLVPFGRAMKLFSDEVEGINPSAVISAAIAGAALAIMADTVPNSGGVVSWFVGNNDIDDFGEKLVPFGKAMKLFSNEVAGIDGNAVVSSAIAGSALAAMASTLPDTDGVFSWFLGDQDLSDLGEQLVPFGAALKDYSIAVKGMDVKAAWYSALIGMVLSNLANTIPDSGGLFTVFGGDNDFASFGAQLTAFGNGLVTFSVAVRDVDYAAVDTAIAKLTELLDFLQKLSALDPNIGTTFGAALYGIASTGVSQFTSAFDNAQGTIQTSIGTFVTKAKDAFKGFDTDIEKIAKDAAQKFVDGVASKKDQAYTKGKEVANRGKDGINSVSYYQAGIDAVSGYLNGMIAKGSDVWWTGWALGKAALQAAKAAVESNSPSKAFARLGMDNGRGLIIGLERMISPVEDAGANMSTAALKSVAGSISEISQMIDDADLNPTITPVLDLSEIQNGISYMGNLIPGSSTFGLTSMRMANGIASPSGYINGSNNPYNDTNVIRSINDLTTRIDSLGADMRNMRVVLNNGALVGEIAPDMNNELGNMNILTRRGVM